MDVKARHRRKFLLLGACMPALLSGCTSTLFRAQSPDAETEPVVFSETKTPFVRDLATAAGVGYLEVQSVALVTRLDGTGSNPPPSPYVDALVAEMQTHGVTKIPDLLASPDTSVVLVRGYLPPGIQKGETFDVEVQLPPRSETTSLQGGWLLRSRMREYRLLNNSMRSGHVSALASGPILVDSLFNTSAGERGHVRGRVLGGGIATQSRSLALSVRSEHASVKTSSLIGAAVNARFHTFDRRPKSGIANPKDDNFIELGLHPRYKNNVERYLYVIANLPVGESQADQLKRMDSLEKRLLEPTSSALAALQLEAIGKPAIPILRKGLHSTDSEVRFFAAEALAYLDDVEASKALVETARNARALRWRALAALSVSDHPEAYDGLISLFDVPSAETRYGAFRSLRTRNPEDSIVAGEILEDELALHEIRSTSEPMIHFSRARRQEIVVFGNDVRLAPINYFYAGPRVLIKATGPEQLKVSRFAPNVEDKHETCSTKVADLIRAIVKVGGGYSDVLAGVLTAKEQNLIAARVEIDAVPRAGREYTRSDDPDGAGQSEPFSVSQSMPDLFIDRLNNPERSDIQQDSAAMDLNPEADAEPRPGFFARMKGWFKR